MAAAAGAIRYVQALRRCARGEEGFSSPARRFADATLVLVALRRPAAGLELAFPPSPGGGLRVTQSLDRRRVELSSTDLWKSLASTFQSVSGAFGLVGGLYMGGFALTNPRWYLFAYGIPMAVAGGLMLAQGLRDLRWEWQIVFDGKQRRLLRTRFGKVFECQELPASVQVATQVTTKVPPGGEDRGCSVALVTPDAKQYLLGNWYSKPEAENLARFLREWLDDCQ